MVLDYLHVSVEYEQLLQLLRIGPFGTSFRNLLYLESFGLSVSLEAGSTQALRSYLANGLPLVAFVNTGQLRYWGYERADHAVVVAGMENDLVYVNDPEFAAAPQVVALDEFELAWLDKDYLCAVIGLAYRNP